MAYEINNGCRETISGRVNMNIDCFNINYTKQRHKLSEVENFLH